MIRFENMTTFTIRITYIRGRSLLSYLSCVSYHSQLHESIKNKNLFSWCYDCFTGRNKLFKKIRIGTLTDSKLTNNAFLIYEVILKINLFILCRIVFETKMRTVKRHFLEIIFTKEKYLTAYDRYKHGILKTSILIL